MTALYVEQPNELMIDLDTCYRVSDKSGLPQGSEFFIERLFDAQDSGLLDFYDNGVWITKSFDERHRHAYVLLKTSLSLRERLAWQAWLGQDWNKSRCDSMREAKGIPYACLLDEPAVIGPGFWRGPDAECSCRYKHESEKQEMLPENERCPAWVRLRGQSRWALFGQEQKSGVEYPLTLGRQPVNVFRRMRQLALAKRRSVAKTKTA